MQGQPQDVPDCELVLSIDTQNSTGEMIIVQSEQQLAIGAVLLQGGSKIQTFSLEVKDITVMEQLRDVLKSFKDITITLSGRFCSTLSVTAPTYQ